MRPRHIIEGMNRFNDGELSRPLFHAVVVPELITVIKNWIGSTTGPGVLIGDLALSFYVKPRHTICVDVLYTTDQEIPVYVRRFTRIGNYSFQHNETHVEVKVLNVKFLGIPKGLVEKVVETAVESNGIKIASKSGIVALKLQRARRQDQADIEQLIESGGVDLAPFEPWLTLDQIKMYNSIKEEVQNLGD